MSNDSTKSLPAHLHAAYDWIDSAGEWGEALATPAAYAAEAAANAVASDQADVTESDLLDAISWFARQVPFARGDRVRTVASLPADEQDAGIIRGYDSPTVARVGWESGVATPCDVDRLELA